MTAIASRTSAPHVSDHADVELLRQLTWDRSAPRELAAAAGRGDPLGFGQAWKRRLRERMGNDRKTPPRELLAGWSAALATEESFSRLLTSVNRAAFTVGRRHRASIKPAPSWGVRVQPLAKLLAAPASSVIETPLGLLCGLELLSTVTFALPQKLWWPLWRATLTAALRQVSLASSATAPPDQLLLEQGELRFLIGAVFGDLAGMPSVQRHGRHVLTRELIARTDTDGTPHSELTPRLPLWLAPLVRSTVWSRLWNQPLWSDDQRDRLSDTIERAVALCRGDGRFALTNGLPMQPLPVLSKAADVLGWTERNPSFGSLRLLNRAAQGHKRRVASRSTIQVMPSNQSDWARLALLRTDWSPAADTLAIAHHQRWPQVDATAAGAAVLHGDWALELRIDGTPIELADEWSCAAWESDPDADYTELQMLGPGRMRVERIVLLSRRDRMLLMADAVSNAPEGRIELVSRLTLAPGIAAEPDTATRSIGLRGNQLRSRVFPLALPCSRIDSTPHQFRAIDGQLELRQLAQGRGLVAPLVFDWQPQRRSKPAEWRTLTVTENGKVVRGDIAAGYRLRVGRAQWLFYRSLKKSAVARAVLGHHTFHETVIARFNTDGEADPLLMIQS